MIEIINKLLWAVAISLILLNSIYFSISLKFPQIRITNLLKSLKNKYSKENISPKDTLIMALSSKIGVGSLAGVAICIYYGGIGTVFWMFISAFFLSIINYIENALSIIYKEKKDNRSGPSYYIKKGLNNKKLAFFYAFLILIAYTFLFTSIQTNTITTITNEMYSINKIVISLSIAILAGVIIIKGIKTISNICNKIFPVMMILFMLVGIIILIKNIGYLPSILKSILVDAFNIKSVSGGIIYTIIITFQRCIFACEAGSGTSAIISGSTDSNNYKLQANIGLIQVYFINFIILGITSLIIITADINGLNISNGIELTKAAFSYHLGSSGELFLLIILALFSFSTIITIYYYGESSLKFITKNKLSVKILKGLVILSIFLGGIIKAPLIWSMIDIVLALLTITNMYAIYKLRKQVVSKLK